MAETGEFLEGLVKSGTMILISEIGDKTFFIAAIMAMRHSRSTVRPSPHPHRVPVRHPATRRRTRTSIRSPSCSIYYSCRVLVQKLRGSGID